MSKVIKLFPAGEWFGDGIDVSHVTIEIERIHLADEET